jgi:colanic acid biosynthesis glycosyl transferase WcaI
LANKLVGPHPRVTIVSQWYPPEQAAFGRMMQELAQDLLARGWDVSVITGFPNHPSGVIQQGYSRKWIQEETYNGVRICRIWTWISRSRSLTGRIATFLTFSVLSAWRILRQPSPDIIFAVMQPLSVALTLPLIAKLKGSAVVFNLQDLHPEAQIRSGLIRNAAVIRLLRAIESYGYRHCAAITAICQQFRTHAVSRGADPSRVFVVENWIDIDRIRFSAGGRESFRASLGIGSQEFLIVYAGSLGHASGAAVILGAAEIMRDDSKCRFLVVGEGPMAGPIRLRASELGLKNVLFLGFQPESKLANMQSSADVSIVSLAESFSEVSVPSKLIAYLAAGRAVVASVPDTSETANVIRAAGAGVIVPPGDGKALAEAIYGLIRAPDVLQSYGVSGRRYVEERMSAQIAGARYDVIFGAVCKNQ